MKTLFLLITVALLGVSCQKESENLMSPNSLQSDASINSTSVSTNSFVFGKFLGKCTLNDCAEFYKIESSQLFPDVTTQYSGFNSVEFSKTPMSADKFALANQLMASFPEYLKQRPNQYFGQPNYYDQGAYSIEVTENGVFKFWQIDTNLDAIPAEIRPWVQQLESVLAQLP